MKNKIFVLFLLFTALLLPSNVLLISDYDFTNQDYTWRQYLAFYENFPACRLNYSQKEMIYRAARVNTLHPLVLMAKLQNETDLIQNVGGTNKYSWRLNRAMGYGMIRHWWEDNRKYKFYKYGGYDLQVWLAAELLRKSFDDYSKYDNAIIKLMCNGEKILVENAATYSLYVYNPFYGTHSKYGYKSTGNKLFEIVFNRYLKLWQIEAAAK